MNLALSSSRDPKDLSMADLRAALGPLLNPGAPNTFQKKLWFQCPSPLFLQGDEIMTLVGNNSTALERREVSLMTELRVALGPLLDPGAPTPSRRSCGSNDRPRCSGNP